MLFKPPTRAASGKPSMSSSRRSDESNISEIGQKLRGGCIKITLRHRRIGFSLRSEKSLYISPVFFQQSLRAILRMTLEMYEQAALFLLDERIHPALG